MNSVELSANPQLAEARAQSDDWTGAISWQERKKRQNRLNQRALRRRRAQNGESERSADYAHQFTPASHPHYNPLALITPPSRQQDPAFARSQLTRKGCAPILNPTDIFSVFSPGQLSRVVSRSFIPTDRLDALPNSAFSLWYSRTTEHLNKWLFPLSSDHLLTVISYNLYRGLILNRLILDGTSLGACVAEGIFIQQPGKKLPPSLVPTELQEKIIHPGWIDMFPLPNVRDNLIRRLGTFDMQELGSDIRGDVALVLDDKETNLGSSAALLSPGRTPDWNYKDFECTTTTGRCSLILWGDPWDSDSWEATPLFLRKWSWAVDGCPEVISATNKWRALRGEEPIPLQSIGSA